MLEMKIIFYASKPDKFAVEITSVNSFSFLQSCDFYPIYNKANLVKSIQSEVQEELIAILTADSDEELMDLVELKQLLHAIPIILIIADDSDTTIHEAHKLRPRFLTTAGGDFNSVLSVVKNLTDNVPKPYC